MRLAQQSPAQTDPLGVDWPQEKRSTAMFGATVESLEQRMRRLYRLFRLHEQGDEAASRRVRTLLFLDRSAVRAVGLFKAPFQKGTQIEPTRPSQVVLLHARKLGPLFSR